MQGSPEGRPSEILSKQHVSLHSSSLLTAKPALYQSGWYNGFVGTASHQPVPASIVPPPASPDPKKLSKGAVVSFHQKDGSSHRFRCKSVLGQGSFSQVWLAEGIDEMGRLTDSCADGVALKDMFCSTDASFRQALVEVEVLEWAAKASADAGSSSLAPRTARCVAHQIDKYADGWRVRMAMSRVPGETLEDFMLHPPSQGQSFTSAIHRGCALAAQLLRQMAPTLAALAHLAWHRDINSRNIMISDVLDGASNAEAKGSLASFWLIDFGLAARSATWVAPDNRWRDSDLAGDCRYWPQSTWFKFLYGDRELEARADLCNQYQTRLDIFGLGLLALEVVCESACKGDRTLKASCEDGEASAWDLLLASWRRYQQDVKVWHAQIYQVFRESGNVDALRCRLIQEGVSAKVMDLMHNLRSCLRTCAFLSVDPKRKDLLIALAAMIDERSSFGLHDLTRSLREDGETTRISPPVSALSSSECSPLQVSRPMVSPTQSHRVSERESSTARESSLQSIPCTRQNRYTANHTLLSDKGTNAVPSRRSIVVEVEVVSA